METDKDSGSESAADYQYICIWDSITDGLANGCSVAEGMNGNYREKSKERGCDRWLEK